MRDRLPTLSGHTEASVLPRDGMDVPSSVITSAIRETWVEAMYSDICRVDKAHAAESLLSDWLEPCHLINKWMKMAQDSLDALFYTCHEIQQLEKLWKYTNADHSSARETEGKPAVL